MQTGYAFPKDANSETGDSKVGANYDSMSLSKKLGLGVEFEISTSDVKRYNDYIKTARELGLMSGGVTMYYQEGGAGVFYRSAMNEISRTIYDTTYLYIKDKYEIETPKLEFTGTIYVPKNTDKCRGTLPISDLDTSKSSIKIKTGSYVKPEHGTFSLEGNGFYLYIPDKDYVGEDYFSFALTDGFNTSETYTVKIVVSDKVIKYTSENTAIKADKVCIYYEGSQAQTSADFDVYEIAVDGEGVIVSYGLGKNTVIPENGFVISASGKEIENLKYVSENAKFAYFEAVSSSVAFFENQITEDESKHDTSEVSAKESESESGNTVLILVLLVVAVVIIVAVAVIVIIKKQNKEKQK